MKSIRKKKKQPRRQKLNITQLIISISQTNYLRPEISIKDQISSIMGSGLLYGSSSSLKATHNTYLFVKSVNLPEFNPPDIYLGGEEKPCGTFRFGFRHDPLVSFPYQEVFSLIKACVNNAFPLLKEENIPLHIPRGYPHLRVGPNTCASSIYKFLLLNRDNRVSSFLSFAREK